MTIKLPMYKITITTYDGELLNTWFTDASPREVMNTLMFRLNLYDDLEEYAADFEEEHPLNPPKEQP